MEAPSCVGPRRGFASVLLELWVKISFFHFNNFFVSLFKFSSYVNQISYVSGQS